MTSNTKVSVNCVWADNLQAATVNIDENTTHLTALSKITNKCPNMWKYAASRLIGIGDSDSERDLLEDLFVDPVFNKHLQITLADAIYQRRGGVPSQEPRVLKIQTENETYQNMGNCLIRTREPDGSGLDIMFNISD